MRMGVLVAKPHPLLTTSLPYHHLCYTLAAHHLSTLCSFLAHCLDIVRTVRGRHHHVLWVLPPPLHPSPHAPPPYHAPFPPFKNVLELSWSHFRAKNASWQAHTHQCSLCCLHGTGLTTTLLANNIPSLTNNCCKHLAVDHHTYIGTHNHQFVKVFADMRNRRIAPVGGTKQIRH